MAGKPLMLDGSAMKRSALPADVRHVALQRSAAALAVSDDGRHLAVAMYAHDTTATVLAVYATEDGAVVHSLRREQVGPARGVCFLADGSLLLIAGEGYHDLWHVTIGQAPERLGRTEAWGIFRDGPGETVALVHNNLRSVAFAPASAPLEPTWTYHWGPDPCVPHIHWGAQVRFIGDTAMALLSGVHTMKPVLLDVRKKTVVRSIAAGASAPFAEATRDGSHTAVWEKTCSFDEPWLWVFRDGESEPLALDDEGFLHRSEHVVFTPDGAHVMKVGAALRLAALASGAVVGEELEAPGGRGAEHGPGVLASRAPLVAWISFNYRDNDFRIHWAAFQPG